MPSPHTPDHPHASLPTAAPAEPLTLGVLTFIPREMPGRPVIERLLAAIRRRGHRAILAHHGEFHPEIARSTAAHRAGAIHEAYLGDLPGPFAACDAVFVRYDGAAIGPNEFYLTSQLATRLPLLNPPPTARTLCNKFTTYLELARHGLPVPAAALIRRNDDLGPIVERLGGFPVVLKRVHGARGRSVAIVESLRSLRSTIDALWSIDRREAIILQEFFPGVGAAGGTEDLRLWIVGGELLGTARRLPAEGEFRANADLGASWEPATATREEERHALRAAAVLGADYLAVDLLRTPAGPRLLDLNSNAEFERFDDVTGADVGAALVAQAERRVAAWRRATAGDPAPAVFLAPRRQERAPEADLRTPEDAVRWLEDYNTGRRWTRHSPERLRLLLDRLGRPHAGAHNVVVAGTNGKGTTAAMLERLMRGAGRRTGLFTSPHLLHFRERIRVDGRAIAPEELLRLTRQIVPLARRLEARGTWLAPCGFDLYLALAALHFQREGVEVGIYEAGIGGEFDASNGLDAPLVGLGQIDLEHTELLGPDLESIVRDKLGLLRPGGTLACQPGPEAALAEECCRAAGAEFLLVDTGGLAAACDPALGRSSGRVAVPRRLSGPFDAANAGLALALARELTAKTGDREALDDASAAEALRATWWPGRMTVLGEDPFVLTDAAHTPGAVAKLAGHLSAARATGPMRGPCTLLLATAAKKCLPEIVGPLAELADRIVVTEASYRAAPADAVAALLRELGHGAKIAAVERRIDAALALALDLLAPPLSVAPPPLSVGAGGGSPPLPKAGLPAEAATGGEGGWLLGAGGLFLTADLLRLFGADLTQL